MRSMLAGIATSLACLCLISVASGESLRVSDTTGRSIDIDLLAVSGNKVTFTLDGKSKEHELEMDRFDAASRELIREAAKSLKPRHPELEIEVVVNKRRKKSNKSFYWVIQDVSSKVKVKNTSLTIPMPKTTAKICFIGRGRKTGDFYKVLGKEEFKLEVAAGKEFEHETQELQTEYDSDNRGYGNVGGYQYDSYVFAILDEEDRVLEFKTSDPTIRSLVEDGKITVQKIFAYQTGTLLSEAMVPASS